jgi:glycosyltransferase involved in cell wall biosynthesis
MTPRAAVVVSTFGRAPYLDRLLDALSVQQDAPPFEVVVVDDGSTDDTGTVLERRRADFPVPLQVLREPVNVGPAVARNRGWRTTSAPFVLFTDDDCVPHPGWLAALVGALDEGVDVAQGRTEPMRSQQHLRGPFSMTVEKTSPDGFFETCNIAYRREWLERLGGFDESFRFPYGEDVDLGWRATKGGATTAFVDDALVEHEIWPYRWSSRLNDIRRREGLIVLLLKHPDLRSIFPSPWYQKPTHPRALVALAGVVGVAARPRAPVRWLAAGAGAWIYFRAAAPERINVRRRDWPWVLPLCLASDLADVASLARSSARHRVLFL